jgi:hypothetical protein
MNSGVIIVLAAACGGAGWLLFLWASRPVKPRNGAPTVEDIKARLEREHDAKADEIQAGIEQARRAAFQERATRKARQRGAEQDRELERAGQAIQWPDGDVDVENANEVTAVTPPKIPPPRRSRRYALGLRHPASQERREVSA